VVLLAIGLVLWQAPSAFAQWAPAPVSPFSSDFTHIDDDTSEVSSELRKRYAAAKDQTQRKSTIERMESYSLQIGPNEPPQDIEFELAIIDDEIQKKSWFHAMRFILATSGNVSTIRPNKVRKAAREGIEKRLEKVLSESWSSADLEKVAADNYYPSAFAANKDGKLLLSALAWNKQFKDYLLREYVYSKYHSFDELQPDIRWKLLCRNDGSLTYEKWLQQASEFDWDSHRSSKIGYRLSRLYDLASSLPDSSVGLALCVHRVRSLYQGFEDDAAEFERLVATMNGQGESPIVKVTCQIDEAQCYIQLADSDKLTDKEKKLAKAASLLDLAITDLEKRHDKFATFCLANAEYLQGLLCQRQRNFIRSNGLMFASLSHFDSIDFKKHKRARSALWWLATNALTMPDVNGSDREKIFSTLLERGKYGRHLLETVSVDDYRTYPSSLELLSLCEIYYKQVKNEERLKFCSSEKVRFLSNDGNYSYAAPEIRFQGPEEQLALTPDSYTGVAEPISRMELIWKLKR